jgi:NAD-dependent deacetylase
VTPLGIARYRKIVVLTGAGVSVASGLRPYRGEGGVWGEIDPDEVATAAAFARDPAKVWSHFGAFRAQVAAAEPNAAHRALADAESKLGDGAELIVITQNIDALHARAGSTNVIELHGRLNRTRCSACDRPPFDDDAYDGEDERHVPSCDRCGAPLRPDIVLFDEVLSARADHDAKRALRDCDLFVAVGTSGTVAPASRFVRAAKYEQARAVLVNLDAPRDPTSAEVGFDEEILGRAEELLPLLLA